MNPLQEFAANALNWLWQTSLAAAVLGVIAWLIQRACGKYIGPRWTYTLWLLVAFRLVLPFAPSSPFSVSNLYTSNSRRPVVAMENVESAQLPPVRPAAIIVASDVPPISPPGVITVSVVLLAIWFLGAGVFLSCCLVHYWHFALWAKRQPQVTAPEALQALSEVRQLLGYPRKISMVTTTTLSVPALFGVLRQRLLIPQSMLNAWTADELSYALLHELVHAKRRDHLLNWGLIFVQAVHWFNPVAWFALKRLRAERELLCDAIALSRISVEQRQSYGEALIKAAQAFAPVRISPAAVPMINQNNEIKRRVSMIAQFNPTPRLVSAAAATAVLLIACITFTSNGQKQETTATNAPPANSQPPARNSRNNVLQSIYEDMTKQLDVRDKLLEHMRQELEIPSYVAFGDGNQPTADAEAIKRLQALRMEARPEYRQLQSLLGALGKVSGKEFGDVISIAMPDTQYGALVLRRAEVEQKLAAVSEQFAADHPEVASLRRTLETIHRQLEDRRAGILAGLQTRAESLKARLDEIEQELDRLKRRDSDAASRYREYFNRKQELENFRRIRDSIQARVFEETISSAMRSDNDSRSDSAPAKP